MELKYATILDNNVVMTCHETPSGLYLYQMIEECGGYLCLRSRHYYTAKEAYDKHYNEFDHA